MADASPFELVFSRQVWEETLRRLLTQPQTVAFGPCRRNEHAAARELLVEEMTVSARPPRGGDFPPLSDWVALAVPEPGPPAGEISGWVQRIGPHPTQRVALALLGLGPDRGSWQGKVFEAGRLHDLQAVRVVGPGMLRAEQEPRWREADAAALERWSRTRGALGEPVWRKVAGARVLLLGAGRNGSALAFYLAALGARQLVLVDPDVLEASNLDAMHAVTEQDVGQPKALALQRRLLAFHSHCAVTAIACSVTDPKVVEQARGVDLIASCVDNDVPRLAAALLARRFLKVHLDVGTGVTAEAGGSLLAGDARLLLPGQGCVSCVGGLAQEKQARYELFAPRGALHRGRPPEWHQQRSGSLVTLNTMTVSIAAQLWLDLLAGRLRSSHWHRLRWEPGEGVRADFSAVGAGSECLICHR